MGIHKNTGGFPLMQWRSLSALLLGLFAQTQLEPPAHIAPAVVFYASALGFLAWAVIMGEWKLTSIPASPSVYQAQRIRVLPLLVSLPLLLAAFYTFSGNRFTPLNLSLWTAGLILF